MNYKIGYIGIQNSTLDIGYFLKLAPAAAQIRAEQDSSPTLYLCRFVSLLLCPFVSLQLYLTNNIFLTA